MNVLKHLDDKQHLIQTIGEERFKGLTSEIASLITVNNLDATPKTLKEFFEFLANEIAMQRL